MKQQQIVSIDHINLSVSNFAESAQWYKQLFGFEVVEQGLYEGEPWGVLRSADSMLCIYEENKQRAASWSADTGRHRIYHFGLRMLDRGRWESKLNEFRVQTHNGSPVAYPHSNSWYVYDPSGHQIEVSCWKNNEIKFGRS